MRKYNRSSEQKQLLQDKANVNLQNAMNIRPKTHTNHQSCHSFINNNSLNSNKARGIKMQNVRLHYFQEKKDEVRQSAFCKSTDFDHNIHLKLPANQKLMLVKYHRKLNNRFTRNTQCKSHQNSMCEQERTMLDQTSNNKSVLQSHDKNLFDPRKQLKAKIIRAILSSNQTIQREQAYRNDFQKQVGVPKFNRNIAGYRSIKRCSIQKQSQHTPKAISKPQQQFHRYQQQQQKQKQKQQLSESATHTAQRQSKYTGYIRYAVQNSKCGELSTDNPLQQYCFRTQRNKSLIDCLGQKKRTSTVTSAQQNKLTTAAQNKIAILSPKAAKSDHKNNDKFHWYQQHNSRKRNHTAFTDPKHLLKQQPLIINQVQQIRPWLAEDQEKDDKQFLSSQAILS